MQGKLLVAALAAALVVASLAVASPDRGEIQGTVTDPQGAVIPGAQVIVRNVDTGVETKLVSNATGFYLATELVPGTYQVRFQAPGFSVLQVENLVVRAGRVTIGDGQLKVGEPTQSIQVTAEVPLVESAPSNFTTPVERRYIEDLPIQGRDIQTLLQLVPGVIQSAGPSASVFGFDSQFGGFPDPLHLVGSSVSANGGQAGANAWYLEGSTNTTVGAESVVVNPSPDAVAEFNLVSNGLAAEFGHTSGAVVNVVLKSGTNDFHGSVYTYNRNSYFSGTNPYARRDETGRPMLQPRVNYNNPGGTLGGPVIIPHVYNGKNRTFFFVSGDISLLHVNANRILTVPLAGEKNGDFRGDPTFAAHCDPANGVTNCLYDPFTTTGPDENGYLHRQPFPEPVIPPSRFDPLAKFYLDSYPDPNYVDPLSSCGIWCNNFLGVVGSGNTTHNYSVKIDHRINDKHQLFVTWLFNPSYYKNYRFPWNGPTAPTQTGLAGAQPYNTLNQLGIVGLTSSFTPTLINEARLSFGRQALEPQNNLDSVTATSEVKKRVQGLNFYLFDPQQSVPSFCADYYCWGPQQYQNSTVGQQAYGVSDNLTKVTGNHTLKFGMNFRRNNAWSATAYGYLIWFYLDATNDPVTGRGGSGLASMLLGWLTQGYVYSGIQYAPWQTNDDWAFYGQDEFRVSRSLTLSYGLRWDVMGWLRERHDALANINLDAMNPDVPFKGRLDYMGSPNHPDRNLFPANKRSFGPRFGFAWSPFRNSKTVVRGSYGLIYSNSMSAVFGHGNGADSTPGFSVPVYMPVTDATYATPAFILSKGAPSLPIPDLSYNQKNNVQLMGSAYSFMSRFEKAPTDPYVQNWSFFVQQQLPGNFVASAGYVGSHGVHLFGDQLRPLNNVPLKTRLELRGKINLPVPGDPSLAPLWGCSTDETTGQSLCPGSQALRPYPQYGTVANLQTPDGYNLYNSGQFRVEKRFSQGFNFIAAYTISKNLVSNGLGALVANTPTATTISNKGVGRIAWIPGAAAGGSGDFWTRVFAEDYDNRARYKALAPDDTPQVFNIAGTWEIPVGKGRRFLNNKGRAANAILGGWKLTQNWNFQSGVPMFFTSAACSGEYISCRPNLVGDPSAGRSGKSKAQRADQWWNANAFTAPFGGDPAVIQAITTGLNPDGSPLDYNALDAYWQIGNIGLRPPNGRIPGFWNADMSLAKEFPIAEHKRLSFRFDMLNALNHMNLGVPNANWCLPPNPDGSTDAVHIFGCQFGKITTIQVDPRSMQFGLKFQW